MNKCPKCLYCFSSITELSQHCSTFSFFYFRSRLIIKKMILHYIYIMQNDSIFLPNKTINYIFHIADIHIPNKNNILDRKDEFSQVFQNTKNNILNIIKNKNLSADETIIYVAGDIFDISVSTNADPLSLFHSFLSLLSDITSVFIIAGNHDNNI